jgi:hypothetical protein
MAFELTIEFSDASSRTVVLHESLLTDATQEWCSRIGPVIGSHIADRFMLIRSDFRCCGLCSRDAGPLLKFLSEGMYSPSSLVDSASVASERRCYGAFCGQVYVPGLLRDIEKALRDRILGCAISVQEVRASFAGFDRVQGMCDAFDCVVLEEAREHKKRERAPLTVGFPKRAKERGSGTSV